MIDNTSAHDPREHMAGILNDGNSAYVEKMEAEGQRQFVASDLMPIDCPQNELEELGFVFGEQVEGDPLFRHATLPEGWRREGSDHSMWSYIVDQEGTRRVAVFYKAAFYDRSAFARLESP